MVRNMFLKSARVNVNLFSPLVTTDLGLKKRYKGKTIDNHLLGV